MRRVGNDRESDFLIVNLPADCRAQVVLDVSRVTPGLVLKVLLELCEYPLQGFVKDIGQCIEPAPMGHSESNVLNPPFRSLLHQII